MRKIVFIAILLLLIFGIIFFVGQKEQPVVWEVATQEEFNQFSLLLIDYPQAQELLLKAKNSTEKIKADSSNYDFYIEAGLIWKGLGDYIAPTALGKESVVFYQKASEVYEKAIEISEGKAWIPYLNLGNVARAMQDYPKAEKAYRDAITQAPGEGLLWSALAELYRYDLKKSTEEVKDIYKEALRVVLGNVNLLQEFAIYLRDIGQLQDALELFLQLLERYPDNESLKLQVEELETALAE